MRFLLLICAFALLPASAAFSLPADAPPLPGPALLVHPVDGKVGYGEWAAKFGNFRRGHVHAGQDVFAEPGTFLLAIRDSVVVETGSGDGRGNYIALYSPDERETYVYFHMVHPTFRKVGDRLAAGDRVGRLGCSGSCDGEHLHFEIRAGRGSYGKPRNPLPLLSSLREATHGIH
jgi:murein DD-endopeptidase MepM/ murein hydrolase activator NlpD